jgi:hypothetical protein
MKFLWHRIAFTGLPHISRVLIYFRRSLAYPSHRYNLSSYLGRGMFLCRCSSVTMFTLGDSVMSEATLIFPLITGSVFHRLLALQPHVELHNVTQYIYIYIYMYVCVCVCALLSSISWSLSLLPHRHVTASETSVQLTFRNPASYIKDGHTATLNTPHFLYFFNKYTYWIF